MSNSGATNLWDVQYLQRYPGKSPEDMKYLGIEFDVIYKGLERIKIPVAGELTGLKDLKFLEEIAPCNFKKNTVTEMVDYWVNSVNDLIDREVTATERNTGISIALNHRQNLGPSRKFYFLNDAVIGGGTYNGFFNHEVPMMAQRRHSGSFTLPFREFEGFYCAGRYFALFSAPNFEDPYYDAQGPLTFQLNTHDLPPEARLHRPRAIWPGLRVKEESEDARLHRVRTWDCLLCKSYKVLHQAALQRLQFKRARAAQMSNMEAEILVERLGGPSRDDKAKEMICRNPNVGTSTQTPISHETIGTQVNQDLIDYPNGRPSPRTPMSRKQFLPAPSTQSMEKYKPPQKSPDPPTPKIPLAKQMPLRKHGVKGNLLEKFRSESDAETCLERIDSGKLHSTKDHGTPSKQMTKPGAQDVLRKKVNSDSDAETSLQTIDKSQQRTSQEDSRTSSSQKKTCGARNVLLSAKSDSDAERNDTSPQKTSTQENSGNSATLLPSISITSIPSCSTHREDSLRTYYTTDESNSIFVPSEYTNSNVGLLDSNDYSNNVIPHRGTFEDTFVSHGTDSFSLASMPSESMADDSQAILKAIVGECEPPIVEKPRNRPMKKDLPQEMARKPVKRAASSPTCSILMEPRDTSRKVRRSSSNLSNAFIKSKETANNNKIHDVVISNNDGEVIVRTMTLCSESTINHEKSLDSELLMPSEDVTTMKRRECCADAADSEMIPESVSISNLKNREPCLKSNAPEDSEIIPQSVDISNLPKRECFPGTSGVYVSKSSVETQTVQDMDSEDVLESIKEKKENAPAPMAKKIIRVRVIPAGFFKKEPIDEEI